MDKSELVLNSITKVVSWFCIITGAALSPVEWRWLALLVFSIYGMLSVLIYEIKNKRG